MPNYDFSCGCGFREEVLLSMKDRNNKRNCPKCKKILVRQIGIGGGIIFKGTGFYQTDYKQKSDAYKDSKKLKKIMNDNKRNNK